MHDGRFGRYIFGSRDSGLLPAAVEVGHKNNFFFFWEFSAQICSFCAADERRCTWFRAANPDATREYRSVGTPLPMKEKTDEAVRAAVEMECCLRWARYCEKNCSPRRPRKWDGALRAAEKMECCELSEKNDLFL